MEFMPPTPRLEMLCHVTVKVAAPQLIGPVLTGERRIIPIIGGRFEGPRMRGEILSGGADWQIVVSDGATLLEARYTLRTDDGALIYVRNTGLRHGPADTLAAIARGEQVDPSRYYFRALPAFETGAPKYAWLNRLLAVCSGARAKEEVLLDFYELK
jgi:hypothetical protein